MKSEGTGLIVRAISCQDFQPMRSQSTNVTDYSASCGKNGDRSFPEEERWVRLAVVNRWMAWRM